MLVYKWGQFNIIVDLEFAMSIKMSVSPLPVSTVPSFCCG